MICLDVYVSWDIVLPCLLIILAGLVMTLVLSWDCLGIVLGLPSLVVVIVFCHCLVIASSCDGVRIVLSCLLYLVIVFCDGVARVL